MKMRSYWLSQKFYDNKKFPYGFSRSGVFSLEESNLLEEKGNLLKALLEGLVFDPRECDMAFVNAVKNNDKDFNQETRVWFKYANYHRNLITVSAGWGNFEKVERNDSIENDPEKLDKGWSQLIAENDSIFDEAI